MKELINLTLGNKDRIPNKTNTELKHTKVKSKSNQLIILNIYIQEKNAIQL